MNQEYNDYVLLEKTGKQGITESIIKNIYPIVEKAITKNISKYKRNLSTFVEARHIQLYDIGPYSRIPFTMEDEDKFFKALEIDPKVIAGFIGQTYYAAIASFNPRCAKDPFTITQLMIVRYFFLKKMQKDLEMASIYLAFSGSFYPSIHYGQFPVVQPQEYRHVMDYVINNELSQKFDLKREGSLIGAIKSICMTWINSYKDRMKSMDDEDAVYVIQQLHNRIKSFMKNIAEPYYKAYENKNIYLSFDSDNFSDDNYHLADNDSFKGERYISTAMNYITSNGVNYKICKLCADENVKTDEIKSIIESIQSDKDNILLIRELVTLIVMEYLKDAKVKEVTGVDFMKYAIISKPNTKNQNILRQQEIIYKFLDENSPQYRKRRSRPATENSYKKAVLTYYVLVISQSNK